MNWSSVTIFLALLFATAYSQRGGRRYHPDQPIEESLAVDNHRFQTRNRGDVEDARRGDGRRTRIQETTEINSRSPKSRTRGKTEELRQVHSQTRKEEENKSAENRQFISRRTQQVDTKKFISREDTRNERFKSRESTATAKNATRNQNFVRGRMRADNIDVEYRTRGTETNKFSSRGVQERGEPSRINQDSLRSKIGETRRSDRDRSQIIRKNNVIETPKNIEPVTERFHSRQPLKEELKKSRIDDATQTNVLSNDNPPTLTTEVKIQDFTSKTNSIAVEKRTRPTNVPATQKFHSRQLARDESRRSRVDLSTEKTDFSHIRGRKKAQELPARGGGTEQRRTRPTSSAVTERFHSRQLAREELPSKRSRFDTSTTEKSLRSNKYSQITGTRKSHEFTSRGSGIEFEKKGPAEIELTERFHSRQLVRDKLKNNRIEDATTESYKAPAANTEAEKTPELPNKDDNAVEAESKVQTENVASEQTTENKENVQLDISKPITSQPDPLSTENTVDFPIKSNDVEEPNRTSGKLESNIPERNSYHRGHNLDFESSKRGRLESSLSRERSRNIESPIRSTEGHRSSRRFTTQSPDLLKENDNSRQKVQRLPQRTRYTDAYNVHRRQKIEEISIRDRTVESPISKLRNNEKTSKTVLLPEHVTESRSEVKITTETQNQKEQKNEVTLGIPIETSVTSTQRTLLRDRNRKPGNRGRGQFKETKALDEKEHSSEVRDDDNYPEVYKQLKKSGTDPKDILALLKARKEVREKLEKTNSKIPQPDASLKPSQQPVFGTDETKTPQLQEVTAPYSNFKSRTYDSETLSQRVESKVTKKEEGETAVTSTEKIGRFSNFRSSKFKQQKVLNLNKDQQTTTSTINGFISEEKKQGQKVEETKERKYNPYNYQEIRSFNRKKISSVTTQRNSNYRNTLKKYTNNDEPKEEDKTDRHSNEFLSNEEQDSFKHNRKTSFTVPGVNRFRSTLKNNHDDITTEDENKPSKNNGLPETDNEDDNKRERKENYKVQNISRFRSTLKNNNKEDERKESNRKNELDTVNEETSERKLRFTGSRINRYRSSLKNKNREFENIEEEIGLKPNNELTDTVSKEISDKVRKFGFTAPGVGRFRNIQKNLHEGQISEEKKDKSQNNELTESETSKPSRRTSFTEPEVSNFKSNIRKDSSIETPTQETQTENNNIKSKYIPRNREREYEKFKARTEKTLVDVSTEPSIKPNYNIYNRNEHSSFRRRSFGTPASEGTDILSTVQYKNSITPRAHPTYIPQRKTFAKSTSTLTPLPLSRFRARKISLSRLFNEEDLKVDNSEDHKLTFIAMEEDDLRPRINDLSIDSLVSESEQSSYTTEGGVVYSKARKRPRYTESHIQKVPPKRRGSESYKFSTISTSTEPEVYTVVGIPYYEEGTSMSDMIITTAEDIFDPATESTTTLIETIPTTSPITTTTVLSTTDSPSISTITITTPATAETTTSSTTSIITTETTTTASTTTIEPSTPSTTTEPTLNTATEPATASTSITEPTTVTATIEATTTTISTRPTTVKHLTHKTTINTKENTTKPKIATTTKVHTVTTHPLPNASFKTSAHLKSSITTKKPKTSTTTTTRKTTQKPKTSTTTTTRKTTQKPKTSTTTTTRKTTQKPKTTSTTTTRKTTVTSPSKPATKKITSKPTTNSTIFKTTKNQISTLFSTSSPATMKVTQLTTTFRIDELLTTKHPNFLSTIAYIARNLTVHTTPYDNANTANFRPSTAHAEHTTPMQHQTTEKTDNYVVYGLLPNNNVVRKKVKTTKPPLDVPFYIYGLYPNGTIVRRFPNGTIVPDETEEENEIIGSVEPGSQESLETVVKKDNPLSYLYPPGYEKATKTINIPSVTPQTTKLNKDELNKASTTELLSIDPRIAPSSLNIEKPTSAKVFDTTTMKITTTSTTKFTTLKPTTKKSTTKPTTTKATIKKSTAKVTTMKPSTIKTTSKLLLPTTLKPTTTKQTPKTTNTKSTSKVTTAKPSQKPTTTKQTPKTTNTKSTSKVTTAKPTQKPTITKPTQKATTTKPTLKTTAKTTVTKVTTTIKPQTKVPKSTTTASLIKTQNKSTKVSLSTTTKRSITTSKGSLSKPTTKPNGKSPEKSTIKTLTTPLSDAELLNNLLNQEVKDKLPKGTTESTALLADKVIQLAIERAQKSTTVPPFFKDISSNKNLQLLSPSSSPVTKEPSGSKRKENDKKLIDETNTNKTGKISLWVIPPEESTTSKPSNGVSKSEIELLNALLASPNAIENLSLSEQLILADVLSSTALPQTTRKKKKKPRTTTTTTTPPPPAFPILQYLFGRSRGGGGGLFQRGLFRGGGLRGLESGSTLPQEDDGGLFQNDGLPQGQGELAAESQNDPQEGERGGLVSAAINVSRAVSQFMGYVIQGAAQSFQNYFQTRTRALTDALSYPAAT